LSTQSLTDLAPGQIIQTNQHIDLPIELHVNGRCLYLGTLGQVRRQVGLQIAERVSRATGDSTARTTRGRIL
jgi:flagellar motor switch protein FliM